MIINIFKRRFTLALFLLGFLTRSWATFDGQLEKKQASGNEKIPTCTVRILMISFLK